MASDTPENGVGGYALLDAGGGERLERFAGVTVRRPARGAQNEPGLPPGAWDEARLVFHYTDHGGEWQGLVGLPEPWVVAFGPLRFHLRPSPSGQLGLFPEQAPNWGWIRERVQASERALTILNAFAYTGGSTLAASTPHTEVCHIDASRSALQWARKNAEASNRAENCIRWIVDDALTFLQREIRRGRRYDALILDPPAFGRSVGRNTWKLSRDLPELLGAVDALLSDEPAFVLLTCHDPSWCPEDLEGHLRRHTRFAGRGALKSGTLEIPARGGGHGLDLGLFARWTPA
jgi:23S rRNA (cytosine1962-C5)-methyltransferase